MTAQYFRCYRAMPQNKMNTYILLRDNKESSPLTLDELSKAALKSTDLIWVECQSVCWQHPHEIQELKHLVGNKTIASNAIQGQTESTFTSTEILPIPTIEKEIIAKNINEDKSFNKKEESLNVLTETTFSDMQKYGGVSFNEKQPEQKVTETVNVKYSRPLDEIKEQYVKNLYKKEQTQKNTFSTQLPAQVKKIGLYAGLIIIGALLMLVINKIGGTKNNTPEQLVQQIKPAAVEPATTTPETVSMPLQKENDVEEEPNQVADVAVQNRNKVEQRENMPDDKGNKNPSTSEPIKEKAEKKNQDQPETIVSKPVSVENISSKLSLNANDFVVGSFGGIRNLELTLHNESKYLLDKVTAELQYLNPEGIIIKTEILNFQSVPAGEKETIAVKKTKRGVKINYKIIKVESKEINNGLAGL